MLSAPPLFGPIFRVTVDTAATRPAWLRSAQAVLALLVLNAFMSMTNWWPTPFVHLDRRLAPEFVLLWVVVLVAVRIAGPLTTRHVSLLAVAYLLLVFGRYFDTTAPALFGRDINLYWDAQQIPRVVWVSLKSYPLWVSVLAVGAVVVLIAAVFAVLRLTIHITAREAAPYALRSPWALALTLAATVLVTANVMGAVATWPYVSRPVLPTYIRQFSLLSTAHSESKLQKAVPPSPAFTSDLGALKGADVHLFLLESYGRITYANPEMHAQLKPARQALAAQIAASGMQVVSAFVESTTFGGASELAQLALISGIDTSNPTVHDLLMTTQRPTLVSLFRQRGYQTMALYPSLSWDWPEKSFYGFDVFLDARDLDYKGPALGFWRVPDQFALARFDHLHPLKPDSPKRLLFFPSITSHMPFNPVPPYQADWARVLTSAPFDEAQMAAVAVQKENWFNMKPGYIGMINYNYQWLTGYLAQPAPRERIYVVLGDHQPAAAVTGEGANWDVPVHIISANPVLLQRLVASGFQPGLEPKGQSLGKLFDLTRLLMNVFDSKGLP